MYICDKYKHYYKIQNYLFSISYLKCLNVMCYYYVFNKRLLNAFYFIYNAYKIKIV